MSKVTTKNSLNNFVNRVLSSLNKTDAQKQQESVERFLENAVIDCQEQISLREADIQRKEVSIRRAQQNLANAEKDLENARFSIPADGNFSSYVDGINKAKEVLERCSGACLNVEFEKELLEEEITSLKEILATFQG
jgi:hypothetical protein